MKHESDHQYKLINTFDSPARHYATHCKACGEKWPCKKANVEGKDD